MERNYDEIIADILIQLDAHTQELNKNSLELSALRIEQEKKNEAFISRMETMDKIDSQLLEQLVHSGAFLEGIIKKDA